jgi:hypothetical protein
VSAEPKLVTPQEAQGWVDVDALEHSPTFWPNRLAYTVASEPDRTRTAIVKVLRGSAPALACEQDWRDILRRADAIENGADY